jgi:hypothetical protein
MSDPVNRTSLSNGLRLLISEVSYEIEKHSFFDVVVGSSMNFLDRTVEDAQRTLYGKLCTFLRDL